MAITVEREPMKGGTIRVIIGVVIVLVLVIATYFLFFTKPPKIEVIAPPEVENITEISEVDIDPRALVNSQEYKALRDTIPSPALGEYGRENPFARF